MKQRRISNSPLIDPAISALIIMAPASQDPLACNVATVERRAQAAVAQAAAGNPTYLRRPKHLLSELEAEQEQLERRMALASNVDVVALHPNAAERYRQKVEQIHAALKNGDAAGQESRRSGARANQAGPRDTRA